MLWAAAEFGACAAANYDFFLGRQHESYGREVFPFLPISARPTWQSSPKASSSPSGQPPMGTASSFFILGTQQESYGREVFPFLPISARPAGQSSPKASSSPSGQPPMGTTSSFFILGRQQE